ncbi:hypothetical protein SAMN04487891_10621 [Flagellimonas taeanensis]|jgi:hypothetical protein|uniref:DUF4832 domain-containing protein n=1 Tax=Flagellimonas taeanensis TaxID=1005926 RepID=A0A1M6Z7L3_9FLAO|nr:hypothetical protein [Allomuricauda taeanensis]SFC11196.1 hypothetical protein SAMN04487891_10621 [Allomuricauda taeanensis]SHL26319.1 hypothetical protein SAMN05216293_3100 [Allomuricauda taeanensis]
MKNLLYLFGLNCLLIACGGGNNNTVNENPAAQEPVLNGGGVSSFTKVQPMTGIVVWDGNPNANSGAHTLEYSYMLFEDVVSEKGVYDWTVVENKLNDIASRNHQAIIRFRYAYVGQQTSVPKYIKDLPDYKETQGISEGRETWFPDWSHQELQDFTLEFYEKFAERYDHDNRLAFLQVGFGLWGEYHIYDGPFELGKTFPSKEYQTLFLNKMDALFTDLHWSISIDVEDGNVTPFRDNPSLLNLSFGLFDDSSMAEEHATVNEQRFKFLGLENRYVNNPIGGEFSYYTDHDQQNVLSPNGPHGESYESFIKRFHTTYMIGNDQYKYQSVDRIKEASINTGYKFEVTDFIKTNGTSKITVKNIGTAPIYYDAYLTINGHKATSSLKSLIPNQEKEFTIDYDGNEDLEIICNRLLSGQTIDFKRSF